MVPGAGNHTVREPYTYGAVELLVNWILNHKLEEITRVYAAWRENHGLVQ